MRKVIARLTLAPAVLLCAGALTLAAAVPAGATTNTSNQAGYRAGGAGLWNLRYVQAEFTVPQHACTGDDFNGAGVQLAGHVNSVAVGVACDGSVPTAGYQFAYNGTTWSSTWTFTTKCAADDRIFASLYYDTVNNYVELYEVDLTTGVTLVNDSALAYGAGYHWATAAAQVNTPLAYAPGPGQNFILVPFSDVTVTSYNGTHGTNHGMNGSWGVAGIQAVNGAHVIFAAPVLYGTSGGSDNTFNTREFGNS